MPTSRDEEHPYSGVPALVLFDEGGTASTHRRRPPECSGADCRPDLSHRQDGP